MVNWTWYDDDDDNDNNYCEGDDDYDDDNDLLAIVASRTIADGEAARYEVVL